MLKSVHQEQLARSHQVKLVFTWLMLSGVLFWGSGCAVEERVRPIGNLFLEDRDVTQRDKTLPFDHSWIDPELPEGHYSKVFFRSVTADKLPKDTWKASKTTAIPSKKVFMEEAQSLSHFFQKQLEKKVRKYPKGTVTVTSAPESHGLVFDIAFTELEFSHPIVRAGSLLVPVPGAAIAFNAISDPHVAFAARVYDGESGRLIATIADRKFPPNRLIDINKLRATSSTREIVTLWAEIIAEALNRDRFAKVSPRGIFRLLPW